MRLSTVFELLIIALLIAFAASRVIDGPDVTKTLAKDHRFGLRKDRQNPAPSRYCTCSSLTCNCCREFSLPVVPVKGPGCATVSYLHDDAMMVTMSFGERVLRNITINSKKPKPICMGMPGGISKFCGRLYSIKKDGDNFKACLGLELRALDDVEAALRVSCFKFGPNGVNVEPGEAIPADKNKEEEDEDDDDYGLGGLDDDDDDDDDDDFGLTGGDDDDDDDDDDDERPPAKDTYNDVDSSDSDADDDYTGFGSLSEELLGGLFGSGKRKPIVNFDDDDDDDDEDDDDEDTVAANPLTPTPQVNVVVMQPVVVPAHTVGLKRPTLQKRPVKVPTKINSSRPIPQKRKRPTTASPVKRVKTTLAPVKNLGTTTALPVVQVSNLTVKPPMKKKKKKPVRTRRPPVKNSNSTKVTPTVVTETTMTVNVVQGDVLLNESQTQKVPTPVEDSPLKIPMSKPVVETKPLEPEKQSDYPLMSAIQDQAQNKPEDENLNNATEKLNEITNEITTQTILQNTIPIDENIDDILQAQKVSIDRPTGQQSDYVLIEGLMPVSTTPSINIAEDSTYQDTTVQESVSEPNESYDSARNPEKATTMVDTETTVRYNEMTTLADEYVQYDLKGDALPTTVQDSLSFNPYVGSTTPDYDVGEEGTDKTEVLVENSKQDDNTQETSNVEEDESEDDDDDDDEEIEFDADLGLDDDDDEEEEEEEEEEETEELEDTDEQVSTENSKPGKKEEYEEVDLLGGILDDDEDEEDTSKKEEGEERTLGNNAQYQINPLLYRLARVSSGSIATARHFPRFSEGRNRRNNKRMRFPSLEITS